MLSEEPNVADGHPRVFISYSWDSEQHKGWVLELAKRLRADGIDAVVDEIHLSPGDRAPQFMEMCIRQSDRVLVICTEVYKRRFDERTGGAGYEGHIISGEIISQVGRNKFIPILRSGDWNTAMPTALLGTIGIDLRQDLEAQYRKLVRNLYQVAQVPPVGNRPEWLEDATHVAPPIVKGVELGTVDPKEYSRKQRLLGRYGPSLTGMFGSDQLASEKLDFKVSTSAAHLCFLLMSSFLDVCHTPPLAPKPLKSEPNGSQARRKRPVRQEAALNGGLFFAAPNSFTT